MSGKYIMYDPAEFDKIKINHATDIDEITRLRAENERLREALKPFVNATVIDLTCNGENFVKAVVVSEDDILCARAILEGTTK
jgi:regulator of replication initiation timing